MPVDYSKWDALELSDDSDIEVHPNVDKRSFIRAKQNQIHQERFQRKHEIETLKYERIVNNGLLTRIDNLLNALNSHISTPTPNQNPEQIVFQSMLESAGDPKDDQPPAPPAGVHAKVEDQPTYSKMMAALIDQVKKAVDEKKPSPDARLKAFHDEVGEHKSHVLDLQQQLLTRLAELEKVEGSKITSESIHTGFSTSHVAKATSPPAASKQPSSTSSVELLNPSSSSTKPAQANAPLDSGSEADIEEGENPDPSLSSPIPDRTVHATKLGLAFAHLPQNDYRAYVQFISQNPTVLAERETDGLLMRAFDLQYAGKETEARFCVHQALLLQYCRALGADGVALFFRRITTSNHQSRKVFLDDVNSTYARLRDRSREMAKETADEGGDVEQIQLHAVHPGQKIHIAVPPTREACTTDEERAGREAFDSFPPGLQRALESGELDEVNKVLGKMSVDEAEEVVGKLSEGGMLSLEEGVIDATTDEGREALKRYEEQNAADGVEELQDGGPGEMELQDVKRAVDEVD